MEQSWLLVEGPAHELGGELCMQDVRKTVFSHKFDLGLTWKTPTVPKSSPKWMPVDTGVLYFHQAARYVAWLDAIAQFRGGRRLRASIASHKLHTRPDYLERLNTEHTNWVAALRLHQRSFDHAAG